MKRTTLLWQLYRSYLIIIFLSLVTISWYASRSFLDFHYEEVAKDLEVRCRLIEPEFHDLLLEGNLGDIEDRCKQLDALATMRVTIISPDGTVLGDSRENPAVMDNHQDRPEVREAVRGSVGVSLRYSKTRAKNLIYVAMPILQEKELLGIIRVSLPMATVSEVAQRGARNILKVSLLIIVLAALVGFAVSRRITRPLSEIRKGALALAQGDLHYKLHGHASEEINHVAQSLNTMAEQLDERIRTIVSQRNEREAILSSMVEGVLAFDMDERIISINRAAARMLDVTQEAVQGLTIVEIVRNVDLQSFVQDTLATLSPLERTITFHDRSEQVFQAHGTVLLDRQKRSVGAVVVLNDVTHLNRLELIRREFVANVSHELKTPITSIKGFVETLLDGAMNSAEETAHFLTIVFRQIERMQAIIEDLLLLSRLEQYSEKRMIPLKESPVAGVVQEAFELCEYKAHEKNITLELTGETEKTAFFNPDLLVQAIVNLVDNAIKNSSPDSVVTVHINDGDDRVTLSVIDHGTGIEKEHLPRLFERFYRVDRARSRKLGGTGLGLAIVKHIMQVQDGQVTVTSTIGTGSTFSLHLPHRQIPADETLHVET